MENTYSDEIFLDQERWELQKKIEEADEIQQGCKRLIRELDDLEESVYCQNRHSKTLFEAWVYISVVLIELCPSIRCM